MANVADIRGIKSSAAATRQSFLAELVREQSSSKCALQPVLLAILAYVPAGCSRHMPGCPSTQLIAAIFDTLKIEAPKVMPSLSASKEEEK